MRIAFAHARLEGVIAFAADQSILAAFAAPHVRTCRATCTNTVVIGIAEKLSAMKGIAIGTDTCKFAVEIHKGEIALIIAVEEQHTVMVKYADGVAVDRRDFGP